MSEPGERFKLSSSQKGSEAWAGIARRIDERIAQLQRDLEAPQAEMNTANVRGRIAELRLLASAAQEDPPPIS